MSSKSEKNILSSSKCIVNVLFVKFKELNLNSNINMIMMPVVGSNSHILLTVVQ